MLLLKPANGFLYCQFNLSSFSNVEPGFPHSPFWFKSCLYLYLDEKNTPYWVYVFSLVAGTGHLTKLALALSTVFAWASLPQVALPPTGAPKSSVASLFVLLLAANPRSGTPKPCPSSFASLMGNRAFPIPLLVQVLSWS